VKRVIKCVSLFCIISIINEIPDHILYSNAQIDSGSKTRLSEGSHDFSSNYQEHAGTAGQESDMTISLAYAAKKYYRKYKVFAFFSPVDFMQTSPRHLSRPRPFEMFATAEV